MHRKNSIIIMLVFSLITFGLILTPVCIGDGCVFIPTVEQWIMSYEEKQMALINYEDGIEELTIAVDIKNSSLNASQAFWIFPAPVKPEDATINITKDIDFHLYGRNDIRNSVKNEISSLIFSSTLTQTYLSGFTLFWYIYTGYSLGAAPNPDLEIFQRIEKMGITSELVYANTSVALDLYLDEKNISLPENATEIIDEYIGKEYSFVVSWISDLETFKKEAYGENYQDIYYWNYQDDPHYIFGLTVTFPTEEIFYPMRLTSIYGDKVIPILIQVNGHVTPENNYDGINTDYYSSYTEIEINTKSSEFTEDLLIKNEAPSSVHIASFISSNLYLIIIIILMVSSLLASLISSFIVYHKYKPIYWKFALIGMFNSLSIFLVFFMCSILKTSQKFVKKPVKEKIISKNIIFGFIITFSVLGILSIVSLISMFISLYSVFLLMGLLTTYGVLMFIYGSIKSPKITLYVGLLSIFFFVFLFLSYLTISLLINF